MTSLHRVFGHPNYSGNGEELTPIELTMQHTDYKSVRAYRKFSGDNAWNPIHITWPIEVASLLIVIDRSKSASC